MQCALLRQQLMWLLRHVFVVGMYYIAGFLAWRLFGRAEPLVVPLATGFGFYL
jgi:hypothetical protein